MTTAEPREDKRPLGEDLVELLRMPRELWLVLTAKFLEYLSLFSLMDVLVLWLSNDLGMNDVGAGWWFSAFSAVLSLFAIGTGFTADSIGFRRALIASFCCSAVARAIISFSHSRTIALSALFLLAVGVAGATPSMNAAVRRYTTARTRSFGFALYYLSINVGGILAGYLFQGARDFFRDATTGQQIARIIHLPLVGDRAFTSNGFVFLVGFGCSLLAAVVSFFLRANVDLDPEPSVDAQKTRENKPPWSIAWELFREKPFWRFMLLVGLLTLVKLIFVHYHATFPKYGLRVFGESFPVGAFMAFNPMLTIVLVPVATALTRRRSAFSCLVLGSIVCTSGLFFFCLPSWKVAPPSWMPSMLASIAAYPSVMLALFVISVGEAIWSPRIYEYTAVVAPKGREASYMGLSSMPFFFAKMIAGPMSGYLLMHYCPAVGPRHPAILWGVIGVFTLIGPFSIIALRTVIEGKSRAQRKAEEARHDAPAAA